METVAPRASRSPEPGGPGRPRHALARALVVLACACGVLLGGCRRSEPGAGAPDVVLLVVDALRADRVQRALDTGRHTPANDDGRVHAELPNLARLARDGVVYERAASPGTWCVPAFASLLTGRWPSYHGAERRRIGGDLVVQPIASEATTLAEILRQRGFHTAAFLSAGKGSKRADDLFSEYGGA
ncbi:sulfatase-like hydrolase/transferase, partial [Candidatus Binatia bacterium]|nr:sulfatase-like hydrolase/transferase [Candidatus Binatia bacterium]